MRQISRISLVAVLLTSAISWSTGQENTQLEALEERVTVLEKNVIKDPFHPDDTVLSRLRIVEERLNAADKAGGQVAKTETREDDQVKRSLETMARAAKPRPARPPGGGRRPPAGQSPGNDRAARPEVEPLAAHAHSGRSARAHPSPGSETVTALLRVFLSMVRQEQPKGGHRFGLAGHDQFVHRDREMSVHVSV